MIVLRKYSNLAEMQEVLNWLNTNLSGRYLTNFHHVVISDYIIDDAVIDDEINVLLFFNNRADAVSFKLCFPTWIEKELDDVQHQIITQLLIKR